MYIKALWWVLGDLLEVMLPLRQQLCDLRSLEKKVNKTITKMVRDLEPKSYEEHLEELRMLSLKKTGLQANLITVLSEYS